MCYHFITDMCMWCAKLFYKWFRNLLKITGHGVNIYKINKRYGTNINVAAGQYEIAGFNSLDYFTNHYYSSKKHFSKKRKSYDLRGDTIPYKDMQC